MKRHAGLIAIVAALVALPVNADKTSTTLLSAVTTVGPSSAISAATPPACGERWSFQLHFTGPSGAARAVLEGSLDGGVTWAPLHGFGSGDEVFGTLADSTSLRVNVTAVPLGSTVSAYLSASGGLSALVTP